MDAIKSLYYRYVFPNQKLHYKLLPTALFGKFLLEHIAHLPRQMLTVDLIRLVFCIPRYVFFSLLLRRNNFAPSVTHVSQNTIKHNMRGMAELSAPRSHILIRPLLSIDFVNRNRKNLRVLSIGPRTEGEIFNLIGYGFKKKNIIGLDLVSYSPLIKVGNLHQMPFDSATFDVVICGWVLGYSDDKVQAAQEILRVTKPGGIVAVGVAYTKRPQEEVERLTGGLPGSVEQIRNLETMESLFKERVSETYFKHDGERCGIEGSGIISIFSVK